MTIALFLYSFPPIAGPGTPRNVRLTTALKAAGTTPVVVTVDPDFMTTTAGFRIDSGAGISDIETLKLPTESRIRSWLDRHNQVKRLAWVLAYPLMLDYASAWSRQFRSLRPWLRTRPDVRILYVSAPPYSAIPAVYWLAKKTRRKLVVDLRDLWTCDPLGRFPSRAHYWWLHRLERKVLSFASLVVVNTSAAARSIEAAFGPLPTPVAVIDNSISEVLAVQPTMRKAKHGRVLTLVHTGTLSEDRIESSRLGGYRPRAVDQGARSLRDLVSALRDTSILSELEANGQSLRVVLAGSVPNSERERIDRAGLSQVFQILGDVPRSEAVSLQANADALLVLQFAWEDAHLPMPYTPGKVFEYQMTGRPILAPVGPGSLRDLLSSNPRAHLARPGDPESVAAAIRSIAAEVASETDSPAVPVRESPRAATDHLAELIRALDSQE